MAKAKIDAKVILTIEMTVSEAGHLHGWLTAVRDGRSFAGPQPKMGPVTRAMLKAFNTVNKKDGK